jgi:thiol-disulfide isomerase/thioredoxin
LHVAVYFSLYRESFVAQEVGTVKTKGLLIAGTLLAAVALVASGCARPSSQQGVLEIGRPAPAFSLADLNGRKVSLDQFKGKVVMLDFWATWCGPCRMTMPLLDNLQKEYAGTMVLLAINLQDSGDVVKDYMREQNLHSQVLLDEEGIVGQTYGADAIPMQVLIDKRGIVRDVMTGFKPSMATRLRSEIEQLR